MNRRDLIKPSDVVYKKMHTCLEYLFIDRTYRFVLKDFRDSKPKPNLFSYHPKCTEVFFSYCTWRYNWKNLVCEHSWDNLFQKHQFDSLSSKRLTSLSSKRLSNFSILCAKTLFEKWIKIFIHQKQKKEGGKLNRESA